MWSLTLTTVATTAGNPYCISKLMFALLCEGREMGILSTCKTPCLCQRRSHGIRKVWPVTKTLDFESIYLNIYIYIYAQYVWSYEIGTVTMINDQRFCVLESSSWSSILHLQITFVNHVVLFVSVTEAVKRIQQCTAEIRKEAWNAVIAISKGKFYKLHRSWGQPAVPIHLCCSTEEGTWRTPLPSQNLVAVPPRLRIPCMLVTRPCRMPNSVLRRHITLWQVLIGVVGVVRGGIKLTLPFGCAWIGNAFLCQLSYNGGNTFGEQRNRSLMQQKLSVLDKKQVCYKGSFLEPSAFIAKMLLWLRHGREG